MYWLNPGGLGVNKFYVNFQTIPGRPMTLVLANRRGTGGIDNGSYARCTGPYVSTYGTYDANMDFNVWVGLDYWRYLGDTILQGVKGYQQSYSVGTHNVGWSGLDFGAKWKYGGLDPANGYRFEYSRDYATVTGSPPTTSGWYAYHAQSGYRLTTYDADQDVNGSNCSTLYDNNPWWYGSCWDGNYFAGGGYQDAPYWQGSSSYYYAYGAAYLCWYDGNFDGAG